MLSTNAITKDVFEVRPGVEHGIEGTFSDTMRELGLKSSHPPAAVHVQSTFLSGNKIDKGLEISHNQI